MEKYIKAAENLRLVLHNCPELSMHEHQTRAKLISFLEKNTKLEIHSFENWFYAVWRGNINEKRIAFRADFDAVAGKNGTPGHFCGHDGHAAILAAFAMYVSDTKPKNSAYFIFQPAEETGEGALLCKDILIEQNIDEIYGFHNIPGAELGSILFTEGTFACASTGVEISLNGKPSHAAYPEAGINPSFAVAEIMLDMKTYLLNPHNGVLLGTVIGAEIGSSAYGVSASDAVLRLTLRGEFEKEFNALLMHVKEHSIEIAEKYGLKCNLCEIERFPATENHATSVEKLLNAVDRAKLKREKMKEPFRWSEDFGYYTQLIPGAFFGVGDGLNHPQLHTENYVFPDAIIPYVLSLYRQLIELI